MGCFPCLLLDARCEQVRHRGAAIGDAVLIAVGLGELGKRSILGVSANLSGAEVHGRTSLESLQPRGP